jgi:hypothetical protein
MNFPPLKLQVNYFPYQKLLPSRACPSSLLFKLSNTGTSL